MGLRKTRVRRSRLRLSWFALDAAPWSSDARFEIHEGVLDFASHASFVDACRAQDRGGLEPSGEIEASGSEARAPGFHGAFGGRDFALPKDGERTAQCLDAPRCLRDLDSRHPTYTFRIGGGSFDLVARALSALTAAAPEPGERHRDHRA
jgi:hypothetical protein